MDTDTVQTNPTSLGGNTRRSNNIREPQTDLDLTTVHHTISKLAERQGQTEQHQDKFEWEIKPIIKKDREDITQIRQEIHQHLTEHEVNGQ